MGKSKQLFEELNLQLANELIGIENGESNTALQMYHELNQAEKNIKAFKEEVKGHAFNEIQGGYELSGFDVKIKQGAVRYDFKGIPAHIEKSKELKAIEEKSKQAYLSIQKGMQVATEDGEEIVLPKVTYNKDSISITKKK